MLFAGLWLHDRITDPSETRRLYESYDARVVDLNAQISDLTTQMQNSEAIESADIYYEKSLSQSLATATTDKARFQRWMIAKATAKAVSLITGVVAFVFLVRNRRHNAGPTVDEHKTRQGLV